MESEPDDRLSMPGRQGPHAGAALRLIRNLPPDIKCQIPPALASPWGVTPTLLQNGLSRLSRGAPLAMRQTNPAHAAGNWKFGARQAASVTT